MESLDGVEVRVCHRRTSSSLDLHSVTRTTRSGRCRCGRRRCPIDGSSPDSLARSVKVQNPNW
ncbi:hypothetical protein ACFPM0_36440 [Pseudonocardia sulfidoxydans]|uniref:hypothetical protein n=1 Tax=Pseudonocardia sulfidoxydans TaxID=54011 RepID=UPI00362125B1